MWSSQSNTDYNANERSAHSISQPINMPNRSSDITSGYTDPHSAVFSPKSTDPANLGVNMCINILEGDNSPRVKDNTIKDVSQRLQNMKIYVSKQFSLCYHLHTKKDFSNLSSKDDLFRNASFIFFRLHVT
ncbi:unnamed protein product [Rotaria socialis]|uniref:Uncharacterized protein n=1 Tax=Rotaria socialis TaxID=392032 RepID=A0A821J5D8_9BILA|nr:unnamed protein product [Rotaria socialis]